MLLRTGGKHPCGLNAILYLARDKRGGGGGGRGLRSVEMEYNATKIKSAVRLYCNEDPAIQMVRSLKSEQRQWDGGLWLQTRSGSRRSLVSSLISNTPNRQDGTAKMSSREARRGSCKSAMAGKSSYN